MDNNGSANKVRANSSRILIWQAIHKLIVDELALYGQSTNTQFQSREYRLVKRKEMNINKLCIRDRRYG